jgi:hypothetical protein
VAVCYQVGVSINYVVFNNCVCMNIGDCLLYRDIMTEVTSAVSISSARSVPVAIVVSDGRPVLRRPVRALFSAPAAGDRSPSMSPPSTETVTGPVAEDTEEEKKKKKEEEEEEEEEEEREESGAEGAGTGINEVSRAEGAAVIRTHDESGHDYEGRPTTLQDVLTDAFDGSDISADNIR